MNMKTITIATLNSITLCMEILMAMMTMMNTTLIGVKNLGIGSKHPYMILGMLITILLTVKGIQNLSTGSRHQDVILGLLITIIIMKGIHRNHPILKHVVKHHLQTVRQLHNIIFKLGIVLYYLCITESSISTDSPRGIGSSGPADTYPFVSQQRDERLIQALGKSVYLNFISVLLLFYH